jgi:hypothetical protein
MSGPEKVEISSLIFSNYTYEALSFPSFIFHGSSLRGYLLSDSLAFSSLKALNEQSASLVGLSGEVGLVGQKLLEVDDCFIEEHASDTTGKAVAEVLLNNGVDLVADKSLALIRVGDGIEVSDVKQRYEEVVEDWLLDGLGLLLAVLRGLSGTTLVATSVVKATAATSAATASTEAASVLETLVLVLRARVLVVLRITLWNDVLHTSNTLEQGVN